MFTLEPAKAPTFYFIGVTTGQSSIMRVFPRWAEALGLDAVMKGIDLPLHAPAEMYRQVTGFLKNDPLSLGALVTTHKLDLFHACKDMFDYIDPFAQQLEEVSSLSKADEKFCAHAKDPISSGLALEAFVPQSFWKDHGGEVLIMGAGGSSLAMTMYFTQEKFTGNIPRRITIANRSQPRLDSAKEVLAGCGGQTELRYLLSPTPADNDALVSALPPHSLVINATGLGKDAPGSPTTDAVCYPEDSLVWEINYRGNLLFKEQAEAQAAEKRLHVEDGWTYFIHGWTQVIEEVFHIQLDKTDLERLSEIAKQA
ncbi:shikimate dehydrogenase [Colidextribacter sp. OB.20]|uniref:shikimate dehydrogenase family protein n=1 Tax=Colidextribacter sp. OB.20 TaxID=2304568 RepID=UPI00136E5B8D|nr:shikimate dehydrogenase [Colidextribacter sp. OB.20]NBI08945.1 shikimate dehydrogenase [Colidextribacter sp. OB.20]